MCVDDVVCYDDVNENVVYRCCEVCHIPATETVSHLEPGVFVFRCGEQTLCCVFVSNISVFVFKCG